LRSAGLRSASAARKHDRGTHLTRVRVVSLGTVAELKRVAKELAEGMPEDPAGPNRAPDIGVRHRPISNSRVTTDRDLLVVNRYYDEQFGSIVAARFWIGILRLLRVEGPRSIGMLPAGVAPSGSPNDTKKPRRRSDRQDRREEAGRAWIGRFRELGSSPGDEEPGDFLTINEFYCARVLEIASNAVTKPLAASGTFSAPAISSLFPILDPYSVALSSKSWRRVPDSNATPANAPRAREYVRMPAVI
jgi:hypothetical protein